MKMIVLDVIEEVVAKVNQELTPVLKAYDSNITGVHFMPGSVNEITSRLMKREQNGMEYDRYPLIALFNGYPETYFADGSVVTTLYMAVVRDTNPNLITKERYQVNFKPVLIPIVEKFVDTLIHHRSFIGYYPEKITTKIIPYWDSTKPPNAQANVFNDFLDAIEITNLTIKLNTLVC